MSVTRLLLKEYVLTVQVLGWKFLQIKILPFRDRKKEPSESCGGLWLHGLFADLAVSQITAHKGETTLVFYTLPLKVPAEAPTCVSSWTTQYLPAD